MVHAKHLDLCLEQASERDEVVKLKETLDNYLDGVKEYRHAKVCWLLLCHADVVLTNRYV